MFFSASLCVLLNFRAPPPPPPPLGAKAKVIRAALALGLCGRLRGSWVDFYAARCLDFFFLLPILEILGLIIQHHRV